MSALRIIAVLVACATVLSACGGEEDRSTGHADAIETARAYLEALAARDTKTLCRVNLEIAAQGGGRR